MKKIVYIISHTTHSKQWEWFLDNISKKYQVNFFILLNKNEKNAPLVSYLIHNNIPLEVIYYYNKVSYFKGLYKIFKFLRKNKPNIIQTELPLGNLIGLTAAYFAGIKTRIMTSSNVTWAKDNKSIKQHFIDRLSYSLATRIITQTDLSADYLNEKLKIPRAKMKTIYHAIDLNQIKNINKEEINEIKRKYKIENNFINCLMIARMEKWKGHEDAIKAIKIYTQNNSNVRLYIFGVGPEEDNIKRLIEELNLENHVILCGFERNILALYKTFNIQIHVPIDKYSESFGLTIIEGMASGIPQILTLSGIAYYIAKDKNNCMVVDYCSPHSVTNALTELIENDLLVRNISKQSVLLSETLFTIDEKVKRHVDLYEEN